MHDLSAAQEKFENGNSERLQSIIKPMEIALQSIPHIILRDSAVDSICHGALLAVPGISKLELSIEKNKPVALFTLKREAVAIGRALISSNDMLEQDKGLAVKPERVLMERGTYPALWKQNRTLKSSSES
jgi:H/ACA ribonucleoprotein complex subunit 4